MSGVVTRVSRQPPTPKIFNCLEKIELKKKYINFKTIKGLAKRCSSSLLNIHREIDITAEEVINKFAEKCRQLYLLFVLCFKQFHRK